jgi:diaminopimelate epimerase
MIDMTGTTFYKMSGSGNDFVMFDGRDVPSDGIPAERIVELCDRRLGIGADGLVVLTPEAEDRVRMDFWNCDGSRADMCGNAALCSTRLATTLGMVSPTGMQLVTRAGVFRTRIAGSGEGAELNLPDFALPVVPANQPLRPGETLGMLATCGVPHLAVVVDDLEAEDLMGRGRLLRYHPSSGPRGANANFVGRRADGSWQVRTYERGVEGETLACGTGAVATAVSLALAGLAELPLDLYTRSGRILRITATLSDGFARDVWLAGEGRRVFTGTL